MRAFLVTFLSVAILSGCSAPGKIDIPSRYAPLVTLEDDASDPGVFHVFGPVLRGPVSEFLAQTQKSQEALLLHEQHIAQDQLAFPGGVQGYIDACKRDPEFLCREELEGWAIQIRFSVKNEIPIDRLGLAGFLSSRYFPPLTYSSALYWIDQVVGGTK